MKQITFFTVTLLLIATSLVAQTTTKIFATEDAYTQGGESSKNVFGVENADLLRVMRSNINVKNGRSTYLKFTIPDNINSMMGVSLHLLMNVSNKNDEDPNAKFKLEVYAAEDNNWSETTLNYENAPKVEGLVGSFEIPSNKGKGTIWQEIPLNTYAIFKRTMSKDKKTITLVLRNNDFNKTAAIITSKDKLEKGGPYLKIISM